MRKIIIGLLIVFLLAAPVACAQPTQVPESEPKPAPDATAPAPGPSAAASDDIVYPPGGFTYRANVHQQGEPDWPPVRQTEVTLEALSGAIDIQYRDYIETRAGENRNNIIFLNGRNAPELLDPLQVYYRAVDLPDGITIERDGQMYGGIGGQDKQSSRVVLLIHIAPQVKPGEYPFAIYLEYEGKDYGIVPCTIKVLDSTSASTPSEIMQKAPYSGNHGIATTKVEPKPGESGVSVSGLMIRLTLDDLLEKSDTVVIGKVVDIFPSRQADWEPRDIITDVVIEVEHYLYGQPRSPYIAIMVRGGRIGEMGMWVEDEPVFNLGEEVALFLDQLQSEIAPPEGFGRNEYYRVTGAMQGKLGYRDETMVTLEGNSVTVSEVEQKISSIYGAE